MKGQLGRVIQNFALIMAMGVSGIGLPACTGARVLAPQTAKAEVAPPFQNARTERMGSPVYDSETDGMVSLPNEPESANEGCTDALYWADEPISSQVTLASTAEVEKMCNDALIACFRRCMNNPNPPWPAQKKGDRSHHEFCNKKCNKAFIACMQKAGLLQTFSAFDAAWSWIKSHGKAIVGTIVIIGGVAYIVSTAGSGALVLVLL
jgi:hypothetical protein